MSEHRSSAGSNLPRRKGPPPFSLQLLPPFVHLARSSLKGISSTSRMEPLSRGRAIWWGLILAVRLRMIASKFDSQTDGSRAISRKFDSKRLRIIFYNNLGI